MWDVPGEVIRATAPYPTQDNWHEAPCFAHPTFPARMKQLREDSDAFMARHGYERDGGRYRIVRRNKEKIAVFCHGGLGLSWLSHLLEVPLPLIWAGFWLAPSSVTTILMDERSKQWGVPRCIGLGDVSHLYEANLPTQPAGIIANRD
jgi:probable phosphoglycerate mutase